ncbi:MAG: outer membrane protein transport protein, partial [Deltaproteobacteria bacterium]|nr:outer membrane protein transport protein [Deltaproteobacteria bacterium]
MNILYLSSLYTILFSTLFATSTWAAGLVLYETGTPDVGRANAGRAAIAKDASTAGGNPAGMTRL